ncbi:MAG: HepT-like ribonuclease domain-containing protein [Pseudonocardiaceae bacterium]
MRVAGVGAPLRDNGDAIRLLGSHGVLPADLADRLRRAVGLRNVLVHDYVDVDDDIVLERLANLADLDDFVAVVARGWCHRARSRRRVCGLPPPHRRHRF